MDESYSTLIVENDSLFREGLRLLLEQTEFSPTTCSIEFDSVLPNASPEILIVFAHEKSELSDTLARFRERFPNARIVVLAAESDLDVLTTAIQAGANAILLTSISAEGLIKSLKAVVAENIFVMDSRILPSGAPGANGDAGSAGDAASAARGLSQREIEILQRVVEGDSNKHIARHLDIAEATVKAHVKTILRKIGASNRTQAAIWAMQQGLDQPTAQQNTADSASIVSALAASVGVARSQDLTNGHADDQQVQ